MDEDQFKEFVLAFLEAKSWLFAEQFEYGIEPQEERQDLLPDVKYTLNAIVFEVRARGRTQKELVESADQRFADKMRACLERNETTTNKGLPRGWFDDFYSCFRE